MLFVVPTAFLADAWVTETIWVLAVLLAVAVVVLSYTGKSAPRTSNRYQELHIYMRVRGRRGDERMIGICGGT